jgi:hypothetical protein
MLFENAVTSSTAFAASPSLDINHILYTRSEVLWLSYETYSLLGCINFGEVI